MTCFYDASITIAKLISISVSLILSSEDSSGTKNNAKSYICGLESIFYGEIFCSLSYIIRLIMTFHLSTGKRGNIREPVNKM